MRAGFGEGYVLARWRSPLSRERRALMRRIAFVVSTAAAVLAPCVNAPAQQGQFPTPYVGENLLVKVPDGYKIDYRAKSAKASITEMVPKDESVKNWTELVTVQIFYGMKASPAQFKSRLENAWSQSCPGAASQQIAEMVENGYPEVVWLSTCPRNPQTGKLEWTWFKAIAGNDSFYVIQKAFRFKPSEDQVVQWMKYFKDVALCDSRIKERSCSARQ